MYISRCYSNSRVALYIFVQLKKCLMRCVTQFAIVTDLENELVQQNEDVIADQQVGCSFLCAIQRTYIFFF